MAALWHFGIAHRERWIAHLPVPSRSPLILVVIQLFIIVAFSRILALGLGKLRQPRVLSEVSVGAQRGGGRSPSADPLWPRLRSSQESSWARLPWVASQASPSTFSRPRGELTSECRRSIELTLARLAACIPPSLPFLNLLATIGLVLFLFTIGLEVDFQLFRKHLRPSLAVSLAGLAIPFGLGCAMAIGLYNEFIDPEIEFRNFMLFIGTASSITAVRASCASSGVVFR